MTHFYELSTTTKQQCEAQASAALLCNLAALGNLCLPNAYSRAAGSRPFKNGFRNHDWSRTLALRAFGARVESLSHPSVLHAASSSKAAVSALAPYP